VCETHIRFFVWIRFYMISDHVESIMTPISDFTNCNANHCPYSKLHDFGPYRIEYIFRYDTKSFTNPSANLCPIPMLPTAMPTTAHIRNYMISDHVESNISISLWHQEFYQPQCQPVPISDFTICNANHCPYSKLHDFGPWRLEYMYFVMTPRVLPTPVPTCAHFRFYQLQCQPLPIFEITWFRTM